MDIDIYAFSVNGAKLCDKIIEGLKMHRMQAYVPEKYLESAHHVQKIAYNLSKCTEKSFKEKDGIIFIGAAGIAVRAIAPFVSNKSTDPAVICIDEKGLNVISLLSGHIGGANKLTLEIARVIMGNPVVTTATDINGKISVDEWAANSNLYIENIKIVKDIAAFILQNKKVGIVSDFNIVGDMPEEIDENYDNELGICISLDNNKKPFKSTLNLIPKIVSVGVGCRALVDYTIIREAISEVLMENDISCHAIKSINSIDLKKEEAGIIKVAQSFGVLFNTYTKEEMNAIEDGIIKFSESNFVKSITGVGSVCERAAILGSNSVKLAIKKTIKNSVTVACAIDDYEVDFKYK